MSSADNKDTTQLISLEPGRPFWLEDSDTFWQVWEGAVDVYAVSGPAVQRFQQVFLFNAVQGQPLFALPQSIDGKGIRLMAMSSGGAELKTMSRQGLLQSAARSGRHIFEVIWFMVEEWLEILLSSPNLIAPPRLFLLLASSETLPLASGQSVRTAREVLWVRRVSGEIRYGRLPDYSIPSGVDVPVIRQGWVTATSDAVLTGLPTDEILPPTDNPDTGRFWGPLDDCHRLFAAIIEQYFTDERQRDHQRLLDRKNQREKLQQAAFAHLLRNDLPEIEPLILADSTCPPILTALRAIARQLGISAELVRLPKGGGARLQDPALMGQIAHLAGMQARKVCLEAGWQTQDNGPLLGYLGPQGEPVALLPQSPDRYHLFQPETLRNREVTSQDLDLLHTDAYMFYVGLTAKTSTLTDWLKFSLKNSWPGDYGVVLMTSLIAGGITMVTPFVTNTIFSDLIPIGDRQGHVMVIQVMMVAALSSVGVALTRGVAVLRIKNRSHLSAEAALWLRLLSLPSAFFRQYESGDLALRLNSIAQVSSVLSNSVVSTIFNCLLSFFSLGMMFYYSWKLGAIALVILVTFLLSQILVSWKMLHNKRSMIIASGRVAGQVLQILNGIGKFRMQGAETQAFFLWAKEFGEEWKWNRAVRWNANLLEVLNGIQPILLSMLLFWLTMHWMGIGDTTNSPFITQADYLSFTAALTGFSGAVLGMAPIMSQLLDIVPILERLRPVLTAEPEVSDEKLEAGELTGQIEVNNLSFRYSPEKPQVLQNLSLKIRPGQFVAIVGSSGSGKSTLLRLLLGFEKPENGAVYFDGQDLAELSVTSVRSQMGVVLQQGQLMAGDIFNNIIGSLPLTIDDAWLAAEMVGLAEDIRAMPMGMHTMVSEGAANISGGQRQRILIARSIVNRPRIIMFDEATSALDNRTQAIVTESLDKLKATRIVVAHRLSTICNAERIFVMDQGKIVEEGNYQELMDQNGIFAAMARRQLM
ncbi:MAG TPA: NHLP bacteriocin export ABC transporter permease/ATPase subunit [Negativicutes bacterium]|nr:NHLP bacteriocin export ABC transporter permease/ATPase subunit [Negativicutes bacterium]